MNSININSEGYSTPNGADNLQKNWAAAFAKHEVNNHKTAPVLDHPDGCVTPEKLSDEVKEVIGQVKREAENASDIAYTAKNTAEVANGVAIDAINEAISARRSASDAYSNSAIATATAEEARAIAVSADGIAVEAKETADIALQEAGDALGYCVNVTDARLNSVELALDNKADVEQVENVGNEAWSNLVTHREDADIHTTAEEKADVDARISDAQRAATEAVVERVLDGLTEEIRITSLPIVGAYTGWQIYADGRPLSENIIPIRESFVTVAGVMTGLTAGFFQNDKEIVRCKINVTEHGSVKYVNFSDYERISEKNEIEYIQKKMVGVHFGRLNSSATGAVTLTDIPDNSLILLASGEGLKLNAKGQSDTLSATAKHLVLWTGSTRDHEVYGITGERMTYLVYTQDMSLTNLKPYNIYTAYTKTKADAVGGDTGISIVCPVHTYIGVIGAEFPK